VKIEDALVHLEGGETIRARTVIWAAGNVASPLARSIKGAPLDRAGRILVEPDLSVPGRPELFVAGDLAAVVQDGKQLPAVAQPAMQGGRTAAKNILRRIQGEPTQPFRYFDKGNMAVIGRNRAIAEIGPFKVAGFPAWLLWLFIHVLYLASFRNRLLVLMEWGYAYFTYQRGVRLIVETEEEEKPDALTPIPSPGAAGEGRTGKEASPASPTALVLK
jgi:NADH:ubiquinone reductase (H+-translocating)